MSITLPYSDLSGLEFTGTFQRTPELVAASRSHREDLKAWDSGALAKYDSTYGSSDAVDAVHNRSYEFNLWVLHYDPSSGLFVARAEDIFGGSGIVGSIEDDEIRFLKMYAGAHPTLERMQRRFESVEYAGKSVKNDDTVAFSGSYQPKGISENYKGIWSMTSQ